MSASVVRLAVAGARRAQAEIPVLKHLEEKVELRAVCDPNETLWTVWKAQFPGARFYRTFDDLLSDDTVDAIFVATPLRLHAEQSLAALMAGKHVLSEVPACHTIEQCWSLVETVEKTKLKYMLAENFCFMRSNLIVLNMVRHGLFGDLIHAEGAYLHDYKHRTHDGRRGLEWRGEMLRDWNTINYPTHAVGPISQWLGINTPRGDTYESLVAVVSKPQMMWRYFRDLYGSDHPGSDPRYWTQGDSQNAILQTRRGVTVVIRVDWTSPRPHNMTHYGLQGTTGAYVSGRHSREDPLVWISGRSPGFSPPRDGPEAAWEVLWEYAADYEHPLWRRWSSVAAKMDLDSGDFLTILEFVDCVLRDRDPSIDVYDAATWSSLIALAAESIRAGGGRVRIPQFKRDGVTNNSAPGAV